MKQQVIKAALTLTVILTATVALAKPQVTIAIQTEKEVTTLQNGQKTTKRVAATNAAPGEILFYTLTYANAGNESATSAVVDNPIPTGTVYLPGSATGQGADISFSIDGGKTFKKPSLLTYEVKLPSGKLDQRVASPEEYTHVRWTITTIPAGGNGKLGFQVKVK